MNVLPTKPYLMTNYRPLNVQLKCWLVWHGHESKKWKSYTLHEKVSAKWIVLKTILVGFPYYWIVAHFIHPGLIGKWLGGFQTWVTNSYLRATGFDSEVGVV